MSDQELRILERKVFSDPRDEQACQALDAARVRRGLGWHGEELPAGLVTHRFDRGVYWLAKNGFSTIGSMQFVYVPGSSDLKCPGCMPSSIHYLGRNGSSCPTCGGANWFKTKPFYLGRFPVMNIEYANFLIRHAADPDNDIRQDRHSVDGYPSHDLHPVVNVHHEYALLFCEWAGTRLPTFFEWRYAALGEPAESLDKNSAEPWKTGKKEHRDFPWGFDRPSQDTVVGHCKTVPVCTPIEQARRLTDPQKIIGFQPARPAGASWCGAHDMAGHVWEWSANMDDGRPMAFGGSFRSNPDRYMSHLGYVPNSEDNDDVGFRVALDARQTA